MAFPCYNTGMPTLRASDLGSYLYCARAWAYQRQGLPSSNQKGLADGTSGHQQHGHQVLAAMLLRLLALISLGAGLLLLVYQVTLKLV